MDGNSHLVLPSCITSTSCNTVSDSQYFDINSMVDYWGYTEHITMNDNLFQADQIERRNREAGHNRCDRKSSEMDINRTQHILNSLMIFSFLIFGGLSGVLLITDAPLTSLTVSLPFAFLFLCIMTLIVTGQIDEKPQMIEKYLREWLIICIFVVILAALVFTLA